MFSPYSGGHYLRTKIEEKPFCNVFKITMDNKLNFSTVDREILRHLFNEEIVSIYFFHKKYLLSPAQLSQSIQKLSENNLIKLDNFNILLTENGRKYVYNNRDIIFRKIETEYWEKIPKEMAGSSLGINDLYSPNIKKVF
jgi:hypothetical protein